MMKSLKPDVAPRMVSIYELLVKLLPLMEGYAWAEDALMDLWKMGAPDPSPASKPCIPGLCELERRGRHTCTAKWGCARVKRLLLPSQFATWWADVAKRQGLDLTAGQALAGAQHRFQKYRPLDVVLKEKRNGRIPGR
jgi:hypothetical protein